jgi:hypothetical protein
MRLPASDTTAIRRLRLHHPGGAAEGADPARELDALRRAIEWADWPRAPAESWIFVRRLEAAAPADQLARSLTLAARAQLQHGGSDNVVRFADLAELLASLLSDLTRGQAAARWYWRRWAHLFELPAPRAVTELMIEHLPHLPAVCARLSQGGALDAVWSALDAPSARHIARSLARHGGFTLPDEEALDTERIIPAPVSGEALHLPIPAPVRNRWAPLLSRLPLRDWRSVAALTLIAMEVAPLRLRRDPAKLLAQLGAALQPAPPHAPLQPQPGDRSGAPPKVLPALAEYPRGAAMEAFPFQPADVPEDSRTTAEPANTELATVAPRSPQPVTSTESPGPAATTVTPTAQERGTTHPGSVEQPPTHRTRPVGIVETRVALPTPVADGSFTEFATGQGGLLYLLNVLDREEAREVMERHAAVLPSGWAWLYRLAQDLELNEADPVVLFLAEQMGLGARDLAGLPPIPPVAVARLRALTAQWYGRFEVWRPELLRLEARIRATPSHVDLHAPLNAVRLPVRLAGLDVNPGWLPWLGRVVTFHYE